MKPNKPIKQNMSNNLYMNNYGQSYGTNNNNNRPKNFPNHNNLQNDMLYKNNQFSNNIPNRNKNFAATQNLYQNKQYNIYNQEGNMPMKMNTHVPNNGFASTNPNISSQNAKPRNNFDVGAPSIERNMIKRVFNNDIGFI